jgi:serine/threonine protein kinase
MAPEVLSPASKYHDASKADIWSFGITLIELLRGRPPLHYLTPRAAMAAIPRTSPPRLESDDPGASKMLRELIHACLHDDPRRRPSASQLLKSFKSYFKQQKYSTIPGSLAKLGKKNNSNDNKNNNEVKNLKIHRSETIYSQWDFDLNTLTIDEVLLEPVNESIKPEIETGPDLVKTLESIIKDDEVATIPEVLEAANIIGTISEIPNQQQKRSVNFRKLEPKYQRQKIKIKIVGGEWDNKDISILPIPCPKDAPDLSRPQRY